MPQSHFTQAGPLFHNFILVFLLLQDSISVRHIQTDLFLMNRHLHLVGFLFFSLEKKIL